MKPIDLNAFTQIRLPKVGAVAPPTDGEPLGEITGEGTFQNIGLSDAPVHLATLISTVIGALTIIAGLAFMLYFIFGAINWIISNGDQQKVETAKNQMVAAGIGIVIVVAAYTITGVVGIVLGIDILNPAETIQNIIEGATTS